MRLPGFTMPLRNGGLRRVPQRKRTTLSALAFSDAPLGEEAERLTSPAASEKRTKTPFLAATGLNFGFAVSLCDRQPLPVGKYPCTSIESCLPFSHTTPLIGNSC